MRGFSIVVFSVLIGLFQAIVLQAAAQPSSALGAGHGYLIDKHLAAGLTCDKCHTENPPTKGPEMATCLACHGGTYEKLAAMTEKNQPNPHASHQGPLPCSSCHHVHVASQTFCNNCHNYDMTTP
jgi:fumarate reductase flavoprotein subunit